MTRNANLHLYEHKQWMNCSNAPCFTSYQWLIRMLDWIFFSFTGFVAELKSYGNVVIHLDWFLVIFWYIPFPLNKNSSSWLDCRLLQYVFYTTCNTNMVLMEVHSIWCLTCNLYKIELINGTAFILFFSALVKTLSGLLSCS